jgi:hypothetical protein
MQWLAAASPRVALATGTGQAEGNGCVRPWHWVGVGVGCRGASATVRAAAALACSRLARESGLVARQPSQPSNPGEQISNVGTVNVDRVDYLSASAVNGFCEVQHWCCTSSLAHTTTRALVRVRCALAEPNARDTAKRFIKLLPKLQVANLSIARRHAGRRCFLYRQHKIKR